MGGDAIHPEEVSRGCRRQAILDRKDSADTPGGSKKYENIILPGGRRWNGPRDIISFPDNVVQCCMGSHILVPSIPFTIKEMRNRFSDCFPKPEGYNMEAFATEKFASKERVTPGWILLRKKPFNDYQLRMHKPLEKNETEVKAADLIWAIIAWQRATLYRDWERRSNANGNTNKSKGEWLFCDLYARTGSYTEVEDRKLVNVGVLPKGGIIVENFMPSARASDDNVAIRVMQQRIAHVIKQNEGLQKKAMREYAQ